MNFQFFESMSPDDAEKFLRNFLKVESEAGTTIIEVLRDEKEFAPYSIASVATVLRRLVEKVRMIKEAPDESLPSWIKDCPSYARGLMGFDDPSRTLVLRGAHYTGESFVRSYPELSWAVGDVETAEQNMPVVAGFSSGLEMAPILIVENLFMRIVVDGAGAEVFDAAVSFWSTKVP
jgi:hypothetical protein